jgi:hypothetical protein
MGLPKAFVRAHAAAVRGSLARAFEEHHAAFGCTIAEPVPLTSGVDPSVVFVGSSISVLKPWIVGGTVPERGIALAQPSLRTHNIARLLGEGGEFEWGGLFTNASVVAPLGTESELFQHTLSFFLDVLEFPPQSLRLRVSAADTDLLALCAAAGRGVESEIDTRQPTYYRHRIGMPGTVGRNFNLALLCPRYDQYRDVGNFIVFEDAETGRGFLEVGYGDTTILRARYDLDHVLDCFPFPLRTPLAPVEQRLFEDAASVSMALWREGLRPSSRNARTKLLGKYLRALHLVATRNGVSATELHRRLEEYEKAEYHALRGLADGLVGHLTSRNLPVAPLSPITEKASL